MEAGQFPRHWIEKVCARNEEKGVLAAKIHLGKAASTFKTEVVEACSSRAAGKAWGPAGRTFGLPTALLPESLASSSSLSPASLVAFLGSKRMGHLFPAFRSHLAVWRQ